LQYQIVTTAMKLDSNIVQTLSCSTLNDYATIGNVTPILKPFVEVTNSMVNPIVPILE